MNTNERIEYIEKEIREGEAVIDEIIDIAKPQIKLEVDYCFGIFNIIIDWILHWFYDDKSKNE